MQNPSSVSEAILHLAGEQVLPIYFGMMQFDCPIHVIAVTEHTQGVARTLQAVCKDSGLDIRLLTLDAYDLQANVRRLQAYLDEHPTQWVFNLTGGTKPMFAAAYQVAQARNYRSFYIETSRQALSWLDGSFQGNAHKLVPALNTIDLFIRIAGYSSRNINASHQQALCTAEGQRLLATMWAQRDKLQACYRNISRYNQYPGVPFREGPLNLKGLKLTAELKGPGEGYHGLLAVGEMTFEMEPWPDIAQFITGGWFECFVFQKLQSLAVNSSICDIAKNLFILSGKSESQNDQNHFQEFDVALTDGYRLTIIECKAGEVKQEHVQKLENLCRRFGGHFGRGIIVFAQVKRVDPVRERITRSGIISAVSAEAVACDPEIIMKCRPGEIITKGIRKS